MHFVEEEHFQRGQVGFPLLLNKALKCGQGGWIWGLYKFDLCLRGMFRGGQVGFVLLPNKAVKWGQQAWMWFHELDSLE